MIDLGKVLGRLQAACSQEKGVKQQDSPLSELLQRLLEQPA